MATQLTTEDARQSMEAHAAAKGAEMREKYGPTIGWGQLLKIIADRTLVRYPCDIVFDAGALQEDECAAAEPKGDHPSAGFTIFVHPVIATQPPQAVQLVLYQLVAVNYGPFASADDAEALGSAALGISKDEYYRQLCQIADQLG
jgi:hypothetical protein